MRSIKHLFICIFLVFFIIGCHKGKPLPKRSEYDTSKAKKSEVKKSKNHSKAAHTMHKHDVTKIKPITKSIDFISLGKAKNTVNITVIVALNRKNGGMNFNGYYKGDATYTIPVGWTVHVTFINKSPVPHSAVVVDLEMVDELNVGEPIFKNAASPNYIFGTTEKSHFSFIADEKGVFALACGVPGHAMARHWIFFHITASNVKPSFKTIDKKVIFAQKTQIPTKTK